MPRPPVNHMQKTGHSWLAGEREEEKPYEFQEFPKHKYHKTKASVVVNNPDEEKKLGSDWKDTPAAFLEPEKSEKPADEVKK